MNGCISANYLLFNEVRLPLDVTKGTLLRMSFFGVCLLDNLPNHSVISIQFQAAGEGLTCNTHHIPNAGLNSESHGSGCRLVWPSYHLTQAVELVKQWQLPCQTVSYDLLPPKLSSHCFCVVVVVFSSQFSTDPGAWFWRETVMMGWTGPSI